MAAIPKTTNAEGTFQRAPKQSNRPSQQELDERTAEKEKENQKIVDQWVNSHKAKPLDEKVFEMNSIVLDTSTESKSLE